MQRTVLLYYRKLEAVRWWWQRSRTTWYRCESESRLHYMPGHWITIAAIQAIVMMASVRAPKNTVVLISGSQ